MPQSTHLTPKGEWHAPTTIPCKVNGVQRLTSNSVLITLDPGRATPLFDHKPGQQISILMASEDNVCYRTYNLVNGSGQMPQIAVKKVAQGGVSALINEQLRIGDTLEVTPPFGHLYDRSIDHKAHHMLLLAAGSGITPLISIARHALAARPDHRVTLIYANSTARDIIMHQALEELAGSKRMEVFHILGDGATGEDLSTGRLDHAKLQRLLDQYRMPNMPEVAMLSGPTGFMEMVGEVVGLQAQQLPLVTCSFQEQPFVHPLDRRLAPRFSDITVTLNGRTKKLTNVPSDQTLLEAADAAGLAMPANCRSGICHRCKAKLVKGNTVQSSQNSIGRPEPHGWILCCRHRPGSAEVEIEVA